MGDSLVAFGRGEAARPQLEAAPTPSWAEDIRPILVQYGNLYPVMSRGLFSFSDPLTIAANGIRIAPLQAL